MTIVGRKKPKAVFRHFKKGVDMRIGMDIATLTLKKYAQIVVLVFGDSVFVFAMKFACRDGCQLLLYTLG
jgi:uncharacterized LabA/DUF88 family protein